jgi:hypothetical protein
MVKVLEREDINNLIVGTTILGTGGGGDPKEGLEILTKDLKSGRKLMLAKASELDPESLVICAYFCGSIPAPGEKTKPKRLPLETDRVVKALKTLEKMLGKKVSAVIPTEIGGGNTAVALHIASILGVPALDGDQVGRSAPELDQSSYVICGVKAVPSVITDSQGNVVLVEDYASISSYESIARTLAVMLGGSVLVMDSPVAAKNVRKIAIHDTVSKAISLGKVVNKARENGKNPVKAIIDFAECFRVFSGSVAKHSLRVEHGFLTGEIEIEGSEEWRGSLFKIWVKNENIIGWKDGEVAVMSPDLICMVNEKGYGITNSEINTKMQVNIISIKAPEIWRTSRGIQLFGPKHFGFNFEYVPVEKLMKV